MKPEFLLFILLCCTHTSFSFTQTDSLVVVLEETMEKRAIFDKQKEKSISRLIYEAGEQTNLADKYLVYQKIIDEYRFYSFDKALEYLEKNISLAKALNNNLYFNKSKLELGTLLNTSGRYKESIDALNGVKRDSLPESLITKYYIAFKEGYSGLAYYTAVSQNQSVYNALYSAYRDSLLVRLTPGSTEFLRLKEKQYRDDRELQKALEINSKRLEKVQMGSQDYSLTTFERSLLFELMRDKEKQKKFLMLSAISDVKASVKDNASLGILASLMFEEGELDRAHRYINFSFDDAAFYNSRLRYVNIANSLPIITKAYEERIERQNDKLTAFLVSISCLALLLAVSVFFTYRQKQKVSQARNELKLVNSKLQDLNLTLKIKNEDLKNLYSELSKIDKIKEHYIGTFLNLYSEYIDKLDTYRKLVRKYVNANQMNALLKLSKSKQMIEGELYIFNKNFDRSFLHIYPNFTSSINSLLKPDEQIELCDDEILNTELRILALIKLGITSSSAIAKILRYSVNTIYNYRAQIKNAAKDKTTFEDMVKNIS